MAYVSMLSVSHASTADCRECHQTVIDAAKGKRYVHMPFMEGNCAPCHIVGERIETAAKKTPQVVEQEQLGKIIWFREAHGVSAEHWIQVPANKVIGTLYYKVWDGRIRSPLQSIALPRLEALAAKRSDLNAPVIKDIRVADVRRGISTTVTIRWQTDEFSDSEVVYGSGRLDSTSYAGKLSRQHEMILVGLDADSDYQYQVISRDLFGNRSESKVSAFTTDQTFIEQEGRRQNTRMEGEDIRIATESYRHDENYLIVFKADRPVSLSLGVEQQPAPIEEEAAVEVKAAAAGTGHPLLKSRLDTNNNVCYECHSSFKGAYSHPVNVFPKAGMKIPAEYPLLPDGRISCMSCHSAHSSDIEYRLIKPRKSELCRGCHRDY